MLTLLAIALSVTTALRAGATVYPLVESWHGKGFLYVLLLFYNEPIADYV